VQVELTLHQLCGQLIVGGFDGRSLPPSFAQALAQGLRGGAILFRRNLVSLAQVQQLCRSIRLAAPVQLPPIVGIDEEGGRVARLPRPAGKLPAMRELGKLGDADLARRAAFAVAEQLAALGFNLDFAPVLDVDSNPANPVIGDRSFSSSPQLVAELGNAFAAGLQAAGVMACGKHFPGHGDTSQDSHLVLPRVDHSPARLRRVELLPFRAQARGELACMMTAHVVYSELDALVPATLSRRIVTQLLRDEFGFDGVIFTDDLEMGALAGLLAIEQAAVRAVEAGCDALLICSDESLQERAHHALVRHAEANDAFCQRCVESAERGLRARRRYPAQAPHGPDHAASQRLSAILAEIKNRLTQ
jgi:beta-N-acetylhexosaminidase